MIDRAPGLARETLNALIYWTDKDTGDVARGDITNSTGLS
jgi:hypothetical protein